MSVPTAYSLAKMYTQLLGREIGFSLKSAAQTSKTAPIFGVYKTHPTDETLVVKADLPLLGSLAGILVGLPASSIAERLKETTMDELLRDAIHELLNITAAPLSIGSRVIFKTMHLQRASLSSQAEDVLSKPLALAHFDVSVTGYPGGQFQVFSNAL